MIGLDFFFFFFFTNWAPLAPGLGVGKKKTVESSVIIFTILYVH